MPASENPPGLDWVPVPNSNVKEAAYRPDERRFYVRFASGAVYAYEGVGPDAWRQFQCADYPATFIYNAIRNCGRDDRYPCRPVQ